MGEVTKTRRTLIVPNQAIATYVTQWTYDSHNRLLEMIYPDEEKVTYSYNLGGQLEKVRGYKSYGYDYVNRIGYDKFEQRTYLKYCNGAETFYTYEPARRRRQVHHGQWLYLRCREQRSQRCQQGRTSRKRKGGRTDDACLYV